MLFAELEKSDRKWKAADDLYCFSADWAGARKKELSRHRSKRIPFTQVSKLIAIVMTINLKVRLERGRSIGVTAIVIRSPTESWL